MSAKTTRSQFLKWTFAAASTTVLAACAPAATPAPQPTAKPAEPAKATEPPKAAEPTKAPEPAKAPEPTKAPAPTAAAAAAPAPAGITTVRYVMRLGANEAVLAKDRIAQFNAEQPNLKAVIDYYPGTPEEYIPKIMSQHAAGTLGDVFWQCNVWMLPQTCAEKGILTPMDPLIAADKLDMKQWYDSATKSQQYKGKQVGLPMKTHPDAAYVHYNKTMLQKAGLPEPTSKWTIDDFTSMAKQLTQETSGRVTQWGAFVGTSWWSMCDVLRAFGGDSYSADGTKSRFNDPKSIEAINWVYSLYEAKVHPNPQALQGTSDVNLMASGRLGLDQSGIWVGSQLAAVNKQGGAQQGFEWWVVKFPDGPAHVPASFAVTDGVSVSSLSKNPQSAFQLAKYLTDKEAGVQLCLGDGVCGSRLDVREDKRVQGTTMSKDDKALFAIYWKGVEDAMPFYTPTNLRHFEIAAYVTQVLGGLWTGQEKPTQAFFDNLHAGVQKIMDLPMV